MKQSAVDAVIRGLKKAGVSIVCYLPDSLFKELYPALDADPAIRTIRVTNEGEGAAICGGVFPVWQESGAGDGKFRVARFGGASGTNGTGCRHPGGNADELPRRTRRKQLVGDSAWYHYGASIERDAYSVSGGP